jgi:hypothetical protein
VSNESITTLRQRLDEPGIVSVVIQDFAQAVDRFVEPAIEVDHDIRGPKALLEFFACQDLARALEQRHQGLKGLLLKFDPHTQPTQLTGRQVNLEDPKADRRPTCF